MVTWETEDSGNWSATHDLVFDAGDGAEEATLYLHVERVGNDLFDDEPDGTFRWHVLVFDACGTASDDLDAGVSDTLEDARLLCDAAAVVVLAQDADVLRRSLTPAGE